MRRRATVGIPAHRVQQPASPADAMGEIKASAAAAAPRRVAEKTLPFVGGDGCFVQPITRVDRS